MTDDVIFQVPRREMWVLSEVAFYAVPYKPRELITVLDVGAHVGAFTLFALQYWPGCSVHAYEPHPESAKLFKHNTMHLPLVSFTRAAVDDVEGLATISRWLHEGRDNSLQASLHEDLGQHGEKQKYLVETFPARLLARAQVLKVDTEGNEIPIARAYPHWDSVQAFLVEIHRKTDVEPIEKIARDAGLYRAKMQVTKYPAGTRWEQAWLRK